MPRGKTRPPPLALGLVKYPRPAAPPNLPQGAQKSGRAKASRIQDRHNAASNSPKSPSQLRSRSAEKKHCRHLLHTLSTKSVASSCDERTSTGVSSCFGVGAPNDVSAALVQKGSTRSTIRGENRHAGKIGRAVGRALHLAGALDPRSTDSDGEQLPVAPLIMLSGPARWLVEHSAQPWSMECIPNNDHTGHVLQPRRQRDRRAWRLLGSQRLSARRAPGRHQGLCVGQRSRPPCIMVAALERRPAASRPCLELAAPGSHLLHNLARSLALPTVVGIRLRLRVTREAGDGLDHLPA
jgi:hypothetical protein